MTSKLLSLWLSLFILVGLTACAEKPSDEFTIVTYNVENFFDVDGVALFDDYKQEIETDPFGYSREKFLTKLQNASVVLKAVNQGAGPEVILFQELEADFTPESSVEDFSAFLAKYADTTAAKMLTTEWSEDFAGFPTAAWMLKSFADHGLFGYEVVTVPSRGLDSGIAHTNALFTRFPITSYKTHPLVEARDIIEAELDINGHPLTVYINHWKSGASNPKREPIRVENAKVLRGLIDAKLSANPSADIIVAGDLNSHYNHSVLFPEIQTGINDVLGSAGDESFTETDLYNLWFELPPEQRYSEVWRGRRGSLMHKLLTEGLYDSVGISYVDGSFAVLQIPSVNTDALGRPMDWSFAGSAGGGVSDHFPLIAKFKVGAFQPQFELSKGTDSPDFEMPLGYKSGQEIDLKDGAFLAKIPDDAIGEYVGRIYQVQAEVIKLSPLVLRVGQDEWSAYAPDKAVVASLKDLVGKGAEPLVVQFGTYRGKRQWVVEGIK